MPKRRTPDAATVRTTIDLPAELWRAAKVRAIDEHRDLRDVVIDALRAHLAPQPTRGGRKR